MSQRPLGAQISHMLKDRGVEVIFGIPGVHNQEMYRGIEEAGLTHVLARHEQGAGFMADGYARATGKPGVAYVITGPGLCNIMTPMGQAYSDSVPMLVITSCLDDVAATHGQLHQMLDQEGAAATVCDWSQTARTAAQAYALIDRALPEFAAGRKRPKHITVPISVLGALADEAPAMAAKLALPPVADDHGLAAMLAKSKRPLFIFGGGCVAAAAEAREVLARSGAAAFTTYAGRGVLAPETPLNFGSYLARAGSAAIIGMADLVIAVGTELAEVDLWRDALGHNAPLLRVDIDPEVLSDRHRADFAVLGDAKGVLAAVLAGLPESSNTDWTAVEVTDARAKWYAEIDAERPNLLPVIKALQNAVPADCRIFSDMTQFAYAAKEVWDMPHAGHWHHPYGFGTLGYALPSAIGGKIGLGDKPVIAIAGDYGFQYSLQELMVAVELELTLPIIIWDNGKLGEIEDSMVRAQIAPNAVIQKNPDFVKLGQAYGAATAAPKSLADLQAAVKTGLKTKGPTLIHVTAGIC